MPPRQQISCFGPDGLLRRRLPRRWRHHPRRAAGLRLLAHWRWVRADPSWYRSSAAAARLRYAARAGPV